MQQRLILAALLLLSVCKAQEVDISEAIQLYPLSHTLAEPGGNITFSCYDVYGVSNIEWMINGTLLDDLSLSNVATSFISAGGGLGLLRITSVPLEYNTTEIQCRANSNGELLTSNVASILIIPGYLTPVRSLLASASQGLDVQLTWRAPSSLTNLTYCVRVVSSITQREIHYKCNLTETAFTYTLPPNRSCSIYFFSVFPVNSDGLGPEAKTSFDGALARPTLMDVLPTGSDGVTGYSLLMTNPVCEAEVDFVDVDTKNRKVKMEGSDLAISETNITFTTQQLIKNHRYNVTSKAANIAGSSTDAFFISTHDVRNVTITSNTEVVVTTEYANLSTATGVLFYFVPIKDDGSVDVSKPPVIFPLSKAVSRNHMLTFSSSGQYNALVYDIESDGTLLSGINYPASQHSDIVVVTSGTEQGSQSRNSHIQECSVANLQRVITANCTFTSSESSVTGFQMMAHELKEGSNSLYVSRITQRQAPASVSVASVGMYRVTILAITAESGVVDSVVEHTTTVEVKNEPVGDPDESAQNGNVISSTGANTMWAVLSITSIILFLN